MINFNIITIFPEALQPYADASILGRAQKKKIIKINLVNLRDFTKDRHHTVDDRAYGGGPGMVLKIEPIYQAVKFLRSKNKDKKSKFGSRVILFSTRGKKFDARAAKRLSRYRQIIFICGRYEGVDERVAQHIADEEISIGDYVLSGGELPALVLTEAISRQIKGVLGKNESLEEIKGSYPVYTRPEIFLSRLERRGSKKWRVPKELLSGNHRLIEKMRQGE
ncbi:MAG: tRNA (guanosine(37)-N1)-methyltransferase TrmD [bacterium]|nr:tRNA (guanosine(37)-N1)-methyltransferase TrmD [bacterium]